MGVKSEKKFRVCGSEPPTAKHTISEGDNQSEARLKEEWGREPSSFGLTLRIHIHSVDIF
jgi:hypothetical protein